MTKQLYIGNLPWSFSNEDLQDLFSDFNVTSVKIATDRETGRSRGFGFVEIEADAAEEAINKFNGYDIKGRPLTVNEARPREERPRTDRPRRDNNGGGNRRW